MRVIAPLVLLAPLAMALVACGGGAAETPAAAAPEAPASVAPEPPPLEPAESVGSDPARTDDTVPADDQPDEPAPPARDPNAQRTVRYVLMPEGLKAEVDDVRFMIKAETVRTPAGFGVRVVVSATASEDRSLLAPKNGPLAFAGAVKRGGKSDAESFGDEREGDGDQPLGAGTTVKLSREWPGKHGMKPLGNGESVELDVGLWGLGTGPANRRAVRQLARVKASVDHWKAKATVAVPPNVKGK